MARLRSRGGRPARGRRGGAVAGACAVAVNPRAAIEGVTAVGIAELVSLRRHALRARAGSARTQVPLAGTHASPLRGRGMDYAESRVYQPGDDARAIDWRRTARSGHLHTKLFREERERSLLLLVDTHASMRFGTRTRFKSVQAARAAALAAWSAARSGDRIGAMAFGSLRDAVTPHGGVRGVLGALGAIARWDAQPGAASEPLSAALARARRLAHPGSRVLLLTDGACTDDETRVALIRLARRTETRVLIVADALELNPPPPGSYAFETLRGRIGMDLLSAAARLRFRDALSHGQRALIEACDASGTGWRRISGSDDPLSAVAALLEPRRVAR
ncbi:MAG: DUF58 domain-containing protein [Proteobacteria bacterium]|nr:DUF58 domain-containing protein [Pseudomonadota bacterium]